MLIDSFAAKALAVLKRNLSELIFSLNYNKPHLLYSMLPKDKGNGRYS